MKHYLLFLLAVVFFLSGCSSGKKALQQGEYFSAVSKAVQRLQSDPKNRKATSVLSEGYPLAIQWAQEEIDRIMTLNEPFKWGRSVDLMEQVNALSGEVRASPAARKIIRDPKIYLSELTSAREKAAAESYQAGITLLEQRTRESAREAFFHFEDVVHFMPGYRDVDEKLREAKNLGTLRVILETIPVHTQRYQLSSEFFYNNVFEYLNNEFPERSFVNFYSPDQAKQVGIHVPDMVVSLEFYDFVVGQTEHSEKEEEVKRRVQVETRDTTRVVYRNYTAKLKTYSDKVNSGGVLDVKISEGEGGKLLMNERVPGSFTWVNEYAMYVGDKEALDKEQRKLTERKVAPLPPGQELFVEFTKPIYTRLTGKLRNFFRAYN